MILVLKPDRSLTHVSSSLVAGAGLAPLGVREMKSQSERAKSELLASMNDLCSNCELANLAIG